MRTLKPGQPPGEDHPSAKLTEDQVREIRARAAAGEPQKDLAAEFEVNPSTISKIAHGKSWTHLGPVPEIPKTQGSQRPTARLTEADIGPICRALSKGAKVRELARHYGVSPTTITKIWKGETWRHVPRPETPPSDNMRKRVWER